MSQPNFPGNGSISPDELKTVLDACVAESSLKLSEDQLDQLVHALLRSADKDQDGVITFEELAEQLQKYPALVENLAIR